MENTFILIFVLFAFVIISLFVLFYYVLKLETNTKSTEEHPIQSPPGPTRNLTFAVTLPEVERLVPGVNTSFVLNTLKLIRQSNDLRVFRANPAAPINLINESTDTEVYAKLTFNIGTVSNMVVDDDWAIFKWDINADNVIFSSEGYVGMSLIKSTNILTITAIVSISVGQTLTIRPKISDRGSTDEINTTGAYVMIEQL
jgi:hypothetical protein